MIEVTMNSYRFGDDDRGPYEFIWPPAYYVSTLALVRVNFVKEAYRMDSEHRLQARVNS